MIDSAEDKICICSWVIKGIKGHILSEKLIEAAKRGIRIELLLRSMYRQDHLGSCYYLKKKLGEQITIHADYCNHAKAAIVDDKEAMIMSANIDSQHGLDSSVEVGFISKQPKFINSVSNFLDRLRAGCVLEFVANPTQNQAAQKYSTLNKPILAGDINLNIDRNYKGRNQQIQKLIFEMENQLIRVAKSRDNNSQKLSLFTDNMIINCEVLGKNRFKAHLIENPYATNLYFHQILPKATIEINTN
jgi:phosphatidylserine/phosphatidylglycerophosphate/cardiolipin synthase-like enzyme